MTSAFPRQPVHGGKDSSTEIALQQGDEFIQRAGDNPSEVLVDGRFERIGLCHIVLSTTRNE